MRFTTLFPELKNFHLGKDVGLIPILLNKYYQYETTIVTYKNEEVYEDNIGVKIDIVNNTGNDVKDFSKYIINNARKIDVLNLYHVTSERNLKWALLYKLLNPKGKVYLKLDADKNINLYDYNKKCWKQKIKNKVLNSIDLITVENYTIQDYIKSNWGMDVKFLPNGFYDNGVKTINISNKENIILTVGRIGAYQKATEILLEAFASKADKLKDWRLVIVGEIDKDFEDYIKMYKEKNSDIIDKIEFVGLVKDFSKIREWYCRSKVFCLPSRYESFGLVLIEALMEGCYIITSNHESATTIVANDSVGKIFDIDDVKGLANTLEDVCLNGKFDNVLYNNIQNYAYENFNWLDILEKLDLYLKVGK